MKPIAIEYGTDVPTVIRQFSDDLVKILRKISFGSSDNKGLHQNVDGVWLIGTTNAVANTETIFNHTLARIPEGFKTLSVDQAGVLYKGATAWSTTQISIKCNVAGVNFKIFLV